MARTPGVLVIDQDPEVRFQVRRLLGQIPFAFSAESAPGMEAVVGATEKRPDVILCGLREPAAKVLQTIELLVDRLPQTPVIVYSESNALTLVRKAMLAGARDFLHAPFKPEELLRSLTVALETEERRRMRAGGETAAGPHASLLTVFGAKGGVGKSTLATNLAVALVLRAGQAAVLVDLDETFGDAAASLALVAERSVTDALRQLDGDDDADVKRFVTPHSSGLAVLAAPARPLDWRGITGEQVRRLLRALARQFDVVIIDTASTLSEVSLAAIQGADQVLWVTTPEYASLHDSYQALQAARTLGASDDRIDVVLNHSSAEIEVRPGSIEDALGCPIFWSVPYDRRLRQSGHLGQALVEVAPASPAAASINDLALALSGAAPRDVERPRLLRRLLAGRGAAVPRRPQLQEREAVP